ncbi:hypothetical protein FVE85_9857 [Porphyridium purpureum]|uniref:Transmembrane protein n=1 Tax=Porphyridium purpureum TaxID=35688 RepID=A0A5J4YIJ4_PORPP|nr:hypothetical protein FVE85_9857 [Porphyridium purpureum]|eukprot:POR9666..scf289_17
MSGRMDGARSPPSTSSSLAAAAPTAAPVAAEVETGGSNAGSNAAAASAERDVHRDTNAPLWAVGQPRGPDALGQSEQMSFASVAEIDPGSDVQSGPSESQIPSAVMLVPEGSREQAAHAMMNVEPHPALYEDGAVLERQAQEAQPQPSAAAAAAAAGQVPSASSPVSATDASVVLSERVGAEMISANMLEKGAIFPGSNIGTAGAQESGISATTAHASATVEELTHHRRLSSSMPNPQNASVNHLVATLAASAAFAGAGAVATKDTADMGGNTACTSSPRSSRPQHTRQRSFEPPTNPKVGTNITEKPLYPTLREKVTNRFSTEYGVGHIRRGSFSDESNFMEGLDDRDSQAFSVSPRHSLQGLQINLRQRVQTVKNNFVVAQDGEIHIRETWKHMKTRAWKRYKTSLRYDRSSYSMFWGLVYFTLYVIFVVIRSVVQSAADFDVLLLMALMLYIAYIFSTSTSGVWPYVVGELMISLYLYYILSPKYFSKSWFPGGISNLEFMLLVITPVIMILTVTVYYYVPYVIYFTKAYTSLGLRVTSQQYVDLMDAGQGATGQGYGDAGSSIADRALIRDQFAIAEHGDADYYEHVFIIEMTERRRNALAAPTVYSCTYVGPLAEGRPHGLGEWIDTNPAGENLFGYFDRGIPVGPFRSNENSTHTRTSFVNLRIVFMDDNDVKDALKFVTPVFGVASVECVVSGEQLLGWPKVGVIQDAQTCRCGAAASCGCIQRMFDDFYRHLDDTKRNTTISVSINDSWNGVEVSGYVPLLAEAPRDVQISLISDAELLKAEMTAAALREKSSTRRSNTNDSLTCAVDDAPSAVGRAGRGRPRRRTSSQSSEAPNEDQNDTSFDPEPDCISEGDTGLPLMDDSMGSTVYEEEESRARRRRVRQAHDQVNLVCDNRWLRLLGTDVLIYVHGFKHSRFDIIRRFGQFLAMANLPPTVKPVMFHWPSGLGNTTYWNAVNRATHDQTADDFVRFMLSLYNAGFRNLHFMLHSMGARVFFYAMKKCAPLLRTSDELLPAQIAAVRSSVQNGSKSNGKSAMASNGRSTQEQQGATIEKLSLSNVILLNPDYEIAEFRTDATLLVKYCNRITLYVDRRDSALKLGETCTGRPSLGFSVGPFLDTHGNKIDLDVIDTTDLQANVGGTHHSFWNINRSYVDDLRDLVVTQKRASHRSSRLIKVGPSIYRFARTPAHVTEV